MRRCLGAYRKNGGGILHGNRGIFRHGDEGVIENAAVLRDYLVRDQERNNEPTTWDDLFATILHDVMQGHT